MAVEIFLQSSKISQVFLDNGCSWYLSNVKSKKDTSCTTFGKGFYEALFPSTNNYNEQYSGVYISRCLIGNDFQYIEHNEAFDYKEVESINALAEKMTEYIDNLNNTITEFVEANSKSM